jgi:translation initiation factor IF-1
VRGTFATVRRDGLYRMQCDAGNDMPAQFSGKMSRFQIKVVPEDRVTVGFSPSDPTRSLNTFRAR